MRHLCHPSFSGLELRIDILYAGHSNSAFARRGVALIASAALLLLAVAPAAAQPGDDLTPYAFLGLTYDDNVLRLPDGVSVPTGGGGGERRGDYILRYGAGLIVDKPISRQRFYLNAGVYRNDYKYFNTLDYTGPSVDTYWDWEVGNLWSGKLGYNYSRALSNFSDQLRPQKNIRTPQEFYFRPQYQLSADLRLRAGIDYYTLDNSDFTRSNRNQWAYDLGIERVSPQLNTLGFFIRYTDGEFPDRVAIPGTSDQNFTQTDYDLRLDWKVTGASRLAGRVGYTERTFPGNTYSGVTGRMTWDWVATGKTSIKFLASRLIEYPEDQLGTAALVESYSVTPSWNVTPKITLGAFAQYQTRDRELGLLDETYKTLGVNASYAPMDNLQLTISYRNQRRTTDFAQFDYTDNTVSGSAQIAF
jgi:exopolysaccharide biosynthesis operon protein EpsL